MEVIENDTHPYSKEVAISKPKVTNKLIDYHLETRLGIPYARNRCIQVARNKGATHIAFVDDDETFSLNWLVNIWDYYRSCTNSTAVQGKVIPIFPDNTPNYMKQFFQPKEKSTGDTLHMCATNNVLVPLPFIVESSLTFDESSPLSMGEDSKFFREAKDKGLNLLYCSEALVYEKIPNSRANVLWLSKRYFNIGVSLSNHEQTNESPPSIYLIKSVLAITGRSCKSALQLLFGKKEKSLKTWLKACGRAGKLYGTLGLKAEPYKNIQGH